MVASAIQYKDTIHRHYKVARIVLLLVSYLLLKYKIRKYDAYAPMKLPPICIELPLFWKPENTNAMPPYAADSIAINPIIAQIRAPAFTTPLNAITNMAMAKNNNNAPKIAWATSILPAALTAWKKWPSV